MGCSSNKGTETTAPVYSSNAIGTPAWSGVHEAEFTDELEYSLRQFISFEARRQGNNDHVQNRTGENRTFFHTHFLGGWPQELWDMYYEMGAM